MSDSVQVIETGCIGTCDLGPVVVMTPLGKGGAEQDDAGKSAFYTKLTPQDIPRSWNHI